MSTQSRILLLKIPFISTRENNVYLCKINYIIGIYDLILSHLAHNPCMKYLCGKTWKSLKPKNSFIHLNNDCGRLISGCDPKITSRKTLSTKILTHFITISMYAPQFGFLVVIMSCLIISFCYYNPSWNILLQTSYHI